MENIVYFDLNKKGTNGSKKNIHRITILGLSLRPKVWRHLLYYAIAILYLIALGLFTQAWKKHEANLSLGYKVYAQVAERKYVEPELADETTQEKMVAIIRKVWRKDWKMGVAIAKCESGLRPDAFNNHNTDGSTDSGLFQVNSVHGISKADLMNPYANAGYAYSLYKEQGLNPWESSKSCWSPNI